METKKVWEITVNLSILSQKSATVMVVRWTNIMLVIKFAYNCENGVSNDYT